MGREQGSQLALELALSFRDATELLARQADEGINLIAIMAGHGNALAAFLIERVGVSETARWFTNMSAFVAAAPGLLANGGERHG